MPEDDIVQIANFLIRAMVDDPESVNIDESSGSTTTMLTIRVAPGQAGQVIGKHGRNIEAVRTFLQACGAKMNRRVVVEFEDGPGQPPHSDSNAPGYSPHGGEPGGSISSRGPGSRFRRRE
jgi:predicted RNA-binding protein YlqC (UPF0109 family)